MGGKQSAAWWREYRQRRREHLAAWAKARRATTAGKARHRHDEAARRRRRSSERQAALGQLPAAYTGHDLYAVARQLVGEPDRWYPEAWEDRMGAVVLELLARGRRRDPRGALARHNRAEARHAVPASLEQQLEDRPWLEGSTRPLTG